jgi:dimethylglycine catabolism A
VDAGVEIRLNSPADVAAVLAEEPDAVILATGSRVRDTGASDIPVLDVDTLLEHGVPNGTSSALIVDDEGHFSAPTAAEALIEAGCRVEIATELTAVADLIDPTQKPFVLRRLALAGVAASPNLRWIGNGTAGVELQHMYTEQSEHRTGVDLVVVSGRRQGETRLRDALRAAAPELAVTVVGDALSPRTLLDAVAEGARVGAEITIDRALPIPAPIPAPSGGQEADLVGA